MAFDLDRYLRRHLEYELRSLLRAATAWDAERSVDTPTGQAQHRVDMSMDSAFVHTRVLYEFLTRTGNGWSGNRGKARSPHVAVESALWTKYDQPMHHKVLHPSPKRPFEPGQSDGDDLPGRVRDFADDVVTLWHAVADQPEMATHRERMLDTLASAVAGAQATAQQFQRAAIF